MLVFIRMGDNEKNDEYEYCPRCNANLTMQKGYRNDIPYWICKGCGEMLINPEVEAESDVMWFCDGCGAVLNIQPGFSEDGEKWVCTECGFENAICQEEIYLSEDEYQAEQSNPYKGMSDAEILELSSYREERMLGDRENIVLVSDPESGEQYVKKTLTIYDKSIYEFLKDHPVEHMPGIKSLFEGNGCLIIIEEYIDGKTVSELLEENRLSEKEALRIATSVCEILDSLHHLPVPIVHRDVKPSNIIVTPDQKVYLLDMNVAKWYDPNRSDDTRHMGTESYAAPEQAGYGLSASSTKADIYALGMLLNIMLVRKFPKEKRASGDAWRIIERCISLDADQRYTAAELRTELEGLKDVGKIDG